MRKTKRETELGDPRWYRGALLLAGWKIWVDGGCLRARPTEAAIRGVIADIRRKDSARASRN